MKQEFETPEDFYNTAMKHVLEIVGNKLKIVGIDAKELPYLINDGSITRWTSEEIDNIVLERYDYNGIMLAEFEWTSNGIKQRDINKDERDFKRNEF